MPTESSLAQSSEVMFKGRWVKVEIYAPTNVLTHICTGHVFCLEGRRLLDHLNDVFPTTVSEEKDFLSMKEVDMYSPRREKGETLQFLKNSGRTYQVNRASNLP
jgi:hypothetical protein